MQIANINKLNYTGNTSFKQHKNSPKKCNSFMTPVAVLALTVAPPLTATYNAVDGFNNCGDTFSHCDIVQEYQENNGNLNPLGIFTGLMIFGSLWVLTDTLKAKQGEEYNQPEDDTQNEDDNESV